MTLQEYGTISFNIGPSKVQKAYINSTGLTINGNSSTYGYVGNGSYPLPVFGGATGANTNVCVGTGYNGGSDFNYTGSYSAYISAAFSKSIYVQTYIINSSDIRIKKEINDIDDDGALQNIINSTKNI